MLELKQVWKSYRVGALGSKRLVAVRDVSIDIAPGEVLSVVGESGSGKTTVGKMVLQLTSVTRGSILLDGVDVTAKGHYERKVYYRKVQGVFQDPFSSYNPIFKADRVFDTVRESYFPQLKRAEWTAKVDDVLQSVRLDPGSVLGKYPHQLSGGQLQRMLIARALLLDIQVLVADEIISMLDASTRIDVLNLLGELRERGLGVLFITHDLSLANYISERVVIMRHGAVVEMGATGKVFTDPQHPYSRNLIASVPQLHRKWSDDPQTPEELEPDGDREVDPSPLTEVSENHWVAAHP
ncbi:ABC transporter ATP-binding protein [Glycomyces harbinensis]|uniref:Peptide/nickel transport system ATP-binding protein n=1 Tax=Glycomyces harbinensis TaxID=58114 RepID=A0A1G7AMB2_9ACTN|nr:ATP-binding cassette domain-containing protein [Glycomyces harbinensis]SDE16018.1 peptide/nickel transport system ATP-binding protein [Glycomyces harbinensis]